VVGGEGKTTSTIVRCPAPAISSHQYVVRGQVKYDGVVGDGYLELWNDFGSKGKFFSRSLAERGPMGQLKGTSGWRKFELPFYAEEGMRPESLTLNVVLPGAGNVTVTQPTIAVLDTSSQWWSEPKSGLIGGIFGSLVGVLGAAIGCLSGMRKAKHLTLGLFAFTITMGAIALIAGLVAVTCRQPWHVYYPLLLGGIIDVAVLGGNLLPVLRRYQADELRRLQALNA